MGVDIDRLEIEVDAQASKANDALDRLVGKLERLSNSLSGLNTANLVGLANGVQRLSGAMTGMSSVKTTDFTRLANNITKLSSLDAGRINQAAYATHHFVNSLGTLKNLTITDTVTQLSALAKGIAQLGYKSSTQAIKNIPQLAIAMRQLITILSKAPKVSQNLIDMTNALANLSRTGASSGRAANSLARSLNTYTTSTGRASKGTFSLASAIGKLYATYWLFFRAFGKIKEAIDISSDLTEVQNVVDVTFGKYASLVDRMSETSIIDFGMSELTVKQISSRFQAMGTAMGFAQGQMADMSIELTKLAADMASFYNVEQADVAEDLESIFTGQTRPLRTYGLDLTQATLQEWAMKQGLDANIQSMSQAEKTLLRYQYVLANTGAAQGDFARTADTWANQVRILKQNFQALGAVVGGTFINALKPLVKALNNAMSHIIAFAKTVSNALGKIFGWTYEDGSGGITTDFENAADSTDDIAGGLSDAEKAAKKLKTHLLAIDELNVLSQDTDSDGAGSGSGSGSGASGAGADGGQWVKTDSIFKNFESELDTLYKLGEYIGERLTAAMNSIDWDKVYEGARNFGTGLADFLNGLISPELFGAVGRTIAGALNTAIYAALSFAETFDFYELGVSIATGINEFFRTFDFGALADSLNTWVDGLRDAIAGFLDTITWKDILGKTVSFLGDLELDTIAVVFSGIALKYAGKILTSKTMKKLIKDKFVSLIGPAFGTTTLTGTLGSVAAAGFAIAATIYVGFKFAEDVQQWIENIEKYGWEEGRKKSADENAANPYKNGNAVIQENEDILGLEGWTKKLYEFVETVTSTFGNIGTIISSTFGEVGAFLSEWWQGRKEQWAIWWEEDIQPWFTVEKWTELLNGMLEGFFLKWQELKTWWSETALVTWWEEDVVPWFTIEKWTELLNNIKTSFKTKWDETAGQWGLDITAWWNEKVAPWFTLEKWTTVLSKIPTAFKTAFRNAANGAIGMLNNVIGGVESMINRALEGLRELARLANKIPNVNIDVSAISVSLPRIPTFATGGFPEDGLFMANSTELVGRFSNGKTAVANNMQIIEGIEGGVQRAVERVLAPYLSDIAQNTRETADKDLTVNIGDREIYKASERGKSETGYEIVI